MRDPTPERSGVGVKDVHDEVSAAGEGYEESGVLLPEHEIL